jgi:hypothetical protein
MKGRLITLAIVGIAVLSACSVRTQVTGNFTNGEAISGWATESPGGSSMSLQFEAGGFCEGDYDAQVDGLELTLRLTCDGGRTAVVRMTRQTSPKAVWGEIELSDGRTGKLYFGLDVD